MSLEVTRDFLLWCTLINFGILLVWFTTFPAEIPWSVLLSNTRDWHHVTCAIDERRSTTDVTRSPHHPWTGPRGRPGFRPKTRWR